MVAIPSSSDIGYPTRVHWAADQGPSRPLSSVTKFIVHDTQGGQYGDEQVLTSAAAPVESAHALIWPDGTLIFMVPLDVTAWTPGNDAVAKQSINVEMTGYNNEYRTEAQYRSLAALFNWCVAQGCPIPEVYSGKSGKPGLLSHSDVPDPDDPGLWGGVSNHTDPGPLFNYDKLLGLINSLGGINKVATVEQSPKPPAEPDVIFVPQTGKSIGFGFKSFWQGLDKLGDNYRLLLLGLPVTNEFDLVFSTDAGTGKKHTVQLFERGGLLFEPENAAPWDNHPMTVPQLLEAYRYAIANNLIFADSRTAFLKWQDSLTGNQAAFAEVIQSSLETWTSVGIIGDQLKQLDLMMTAWRAGKSYADYQAGK